MTTPLLSTKLNPPPGRPELVTRPRLVARLDEGLAVGLTLISAPAGFGKTTLIGDWGSGIAQPRNSQSSVSTPQLTWLSLDEGDNDPARFFAYLLAALQRINGEIGQAAQAMLQAQPPPPAEVLLTSLINDLVAMPDPFVLVLDDYHVIHTLAIHQQLSFLLDHRPAALRLIIATREDPPLPLARLRARGQIVEIRQADLCFSPEEATEFLRRATQVSLAPADVAALHERTEGWIAGLQLAALSIQGQADTHRIIASFTGSHRFVLDYLLEEVFQRQTPEVRDFLLHTAILERLCAGLCEAILSRGAEEQMDRGELTSASSPLRTSAQAVLEHLDRANLFIIPLDPERHWYRYHHLFAELLRHRGQVELGERVGLLHRRASAWYAAQDLLPEAVQHSLAGRDWEQAASLIQASSDMMLKRGELVTLLNWWQALPEDLVRARPRLCATYSWALILTGQHDAAESFLGRAEAAVQDDPALLGDILAAQALIARGRGDNRHAIELSERILSLVPPDAFPVRSLAALNVGIARFNSGDLAQAERALTEAEHAARQIGSHYPRLVALTILGVIQASWGRLRQAAEMLQQTIRSTGDSPAVALAHLEMGALLYEWNELAAAAEHLERGLELSQRGGNAEIEIGGYRTLARLKQAQGDASAALKLLEQADQFARDHHLPANMIARNAACHVQIALAQGDLGTALRWAVQVTEDADPNPFYPHLNLAAARLLLAQGQRAAATRKLAELYEIATRAGWSSGVLAVRVWQAVAAETSEAGLGFLADALQRGRPERFIRIFMDAGRPLIPLLYEAIRRGIAADYAGEILQAIGAKAAPAAAGISLLIEPLSERELEVLRLMAAGLSNRAIAEKLILSEGTVKTHIHNLSGKLGAANRTEAVARSRDLHLI